MIKGDNILSVGTPAGGGISIIANDPVTSGGGGGGDSPPITTELQLYINPDADVYSDTGTTLAVDGDSIRQVNDQSGNGNTIEQATASKQYLYATDALGTGNSAFHILAYADHMDFSNTLTIQGATKSLTFYCVYDKTNTSSISYLFGTTDGNFNRILEYGNNTIYFQDTDGDTWSAPITNAGDFAIRAFTLDTTTDTVKTYVNGTLIGNRARSKTWGDFNFDSFWGAGFIGYVGNVLLYSDLHDATQVAEVSDWLNTKYSIY